MLNDAEAKVLGLQTALKPPERERRRKEGREERAEENKDSSHS